MTRSDCQRIRDSLIKQCNGVKVKVNFLGKAMCFILTLWSSLTFLLFLGFFINFTVDIPFIVRINLHDNTFFDFCEDAASRFVDCQSLSGFVVNVIFNIFLVLTFWLQHVLMAKLSFKIKMSRMFPEYILIERPMYNLAAQIIFFVSFSLWQPLDLVVFDLLDVPYFHNIIMILGTVIFTSSVISVNKQSDLLGWEFFKLVYSKKSGSQILFSEKYFPVDQDAIQITRIYRMCRHPMQLGVIMIILSIGKIWSVSRIIFSFAMIGGIIVGITYEEIRLESLYDSYKLYKKKNTFRLIPNMFALFASDESKENNNEELDEKAEEKKNEGDKNSPGRKKKQ